MPATKATFEIDFNITTISPAKPKSKSADHPGIIVKEGTKTVVNFREELMCQLAGYNFMLTPQQQKRILCIFEWAIILNCFFIQTQKAPTKFGKYFRILTEKAKRLVKLSAKFNQLKTTFQVRNRNKTTIVYTGTPKQVFTDKHVQFFENYCLFNEENSELHLLKSSARFDYRRAKFVESRFTDGVRCECNTSVAPMSPPKHYISITVAIKED